MQDQTHRKTPPTGAAKAALRGFVLVLATAEVSVAAYLWYALFVDDTTAWIGLLLEGTNDLWQTVIAPWGIAGALALGLGLADRLLWVALACVIAAPAVSAAMLLT